jgi:hypothetical protein
MNDATKPVDRKLIPVKLFFVKAQDVRPDDFIMLFDNNDRQSPSVVESMNTFSHVKTVRPYKSNVEIISTLRESINPIRNIVDPDSWLILVQDAGG